MPFTQAGGRRDEGLAHGDTAQRREEGLFCTVSGHARAALSLPTNGADVTVLFLEELLQGPHENIWEQASKSANAGHTGWWLEPPSPHAAPSSTPACRSGVPAPTAGQRGRLIWEEVPGVSGCCLDGLNEEGLRKKWGPQGVGLLQLPFLQAT